MEIEVYKILTRSYSKNVNLHLELHQGAQSEAGQLEMSL